MTIRKLPDTKKRLDRVAMLIKNIILEESALQKISFDVLAVRPSKDLRSAKISVYSEVLSEEELMPKLENIRIIIQKKIAMHGLRHTPVLKFAWDHEDIFLFKLAQETDV